MKKLFERLTQRSVQREREQVSELQVNHKSILVIGKAKTGTTFLARAIQTSLEPCNLVMEPKKPEFVFDRYGHPASANEVAKLIFEHWIDKRNFLQALVADELPVKFDKKVVIVRDPRDELVSRLLYLVKPLRDQGKLTTENLSQWLDVLRAIETGESKMSFLNLVQEADRLFKTDLIGSFVTYLDEFSAFYKQKPNSLFAIRYEDLVDHNISHLEDYLGFRLNFEVKEDELIQRTKRSSSYGSWKGFLKQEDIGFFQPILSDFMAKIGYSDWSLNDSLPSKEVTSEYVERLAG